MDQGQRILITSTITLSRVRVITYRTGSVALQGRITVVVQNVLRKDEFGQMRRESEERNRKRLNCETN